MPTTHSYACQAAAEAHQRAVAEHAAKFPNACARCHGQGGKAFPGTREEPPDYEECEECLGQCRCPGCGAAEPIFKAWAEGDGPFAGGTCQPTLRCPACGWTHDGSGAVPEGDGCICWQDDTYDADADPANQEPMCVAVDVMGALLWHATKDGADPTSCEPTTDAAECGDLIVGRADAARRQPTCPHCLAMLAMPAVNRGGGW
jgi:hypothetical protein